MRLYLPGLVPSSPEKRPPRGSLSENFRGRIFASSDCRETTLRCSDVYGTLPPPSGSIEPSNNTPPGSRFTVTSWPSISSALGSALFAVVPVAEGQMPPDPPPGSATAYRRGTPSVSCEQSGKERIAGERREPVPVDKRVLCGPHTAGGLESLRISRYPRPAATWIHSQPMK